MNEALQAARLAADIMLALVPHDTAKEFLEEAAIRRANDIADAAEKLKFAQDADTEPSAT